MMDLDEIERAKEQDAAQRSIKQKRYQVGAGKVSNSEELQREHGRWRFRFDYQETDNGAATK